MSRGIKDFKSFDDAYADEKSEISRRTPMERILLLHRLIAVWKKFPRLINPTDDVPVLKRIKPTDENQ